MISFTVDRSSVCMGDDVEIHDVGYTMNDEADLAYLLGQLKADGFFPNIHGNNVVWVLMSGGKRVFSYFTKTERVFPELSGRKISDILPENNRLRFSYFTSPAGWKQYINIRNIDACSEKTEHCDLLTEGGGNE